MSCGRTTSAGHCPDRTGWAGQTGQDKLGWTDLAGQSQQDNLSRTSSARQPQQDSQCKTCKTAGAGELIKKDINSIWHGKNHTGTFSTVQYHTSFFTVVLLSPIIYKFLFIFCRSSTNKLKRMNQTKNCLFLFICNLFLWFKWLLEKR